MCGIAAGIVLGGLMVILAGGRVVDLGNLAWPAILTALVLGVVLAVLAAAYPARLASRVSIIRAVGYE
jgi:ABC-type antimicrobial peptide transport system permease subunit